jgi:acyl-coenzyme A thioesterase PaaI-like protein
MKNPNHAYIERVNRLVNHSPYFSLLSMKIVDIGVGYSHLDIDIGQKHLQPFG